MKVAIIGAGPAGLVAIKKSLEYNVKCFAFEITKNIGGTWVCYEEIQDEYKDQVPTAMYPSLRTNIPTDVMEFRNYKFKPESGRCFPSRSEVLQYLNDFARDFNLLPHIKFSHKVTNVSRKNSDWIISVKNLENGNCFEEKFDAVMVCSGHFSAARYPDIPGMETFPYDLIHSCKYRTNDSYEGKIVLIVGYGPSGLDISRHIASVAKKVCIRFTVFLSRRGKKPMTFALNNMFEKPGVKQIFNNAIYFDDETTESVDAIILCTGFLYNYPFLDHTCEINITDNSVLSPLYKNLINAKHPTMCFVGLMQVSIVFPLLELQAEVFIKSISGLVQLPSSEKMCSEFEKKYEEKVKANVALSHYYDLTAETEKKYFYELYDLGKCQPYPPVLIDIHSKLREIFATDFDNLRNYNFEVIDDYTFTVHLQVPK